MILSYASGWVLIPGALIALVLSLVQPRTPGERGLGAITLTLGAGLLLQAAVWGDTTMIQERYVFYLIPLVATCFGLYAARGFPYRRLHAALALGLLVLAVRVPLSEWGAARARRSLAAASWSPDSWLDAGKHRQRCARDHDRRDSVRAACSRRTVAAARSRFAVTRRGHRELHGRIRRCLASRSQRVQRAGEPDVCRQIPRGSTTHTSGRRRCSAGPVDLPTSCSSSGTERSTGWRSSPESRLRINWRRKTCA